MRGETGSDTAPTEGGLRHSPLAIPEFRRLWVGQFATNVGIMIQSVAAAWVMTTLTQSPQWIASVQAAINAPVMVWALVAGVLADRYDRRLVMLGAQILLLLAAIVLTACGVMGLIGPWLLLSLTFVVGSASSIRGPAWNASVPELVGREAIPQAVSLNAIAFNAGRCIGPGIGGVIVASFGPNMAFAVNAVLAAVMIQALLAWRRPKQPTANARAQGLVAEAVALLREDRRFRILLARVLCFGFTGTVLWSLMPALAQVRYAAGADLFGFMLTAFGLGSVLGALVIPVLRKASTRYVTMAMTGLFNLSSLLVSQSNELWQTLPLLIAAGLAWVVTLAMFNIDVQLSVPARVMGRAFALYQMMIFGGMAIGAIVWGAVAEAFSLPVAFLIAAVLGLFSVLLACRPGSQAKTSPKDLQETD